jgi:uncharacterized membrane protein YccC
MALTPRQQKKRQMVRGGYAGIGVGALLLVIALSAGSIVLGVLGVIVLVLAGWATRTIRGL